MKRTTVTEKFNEEGKLIERVTVDEEWEDKEQQIVIPPSWQPRQGGWTDSPYPWWEQPVTFSQSNTIKSPTSINQETLDEITEQIRNSRIVSMV